MSEKEREKERKAQTDAEINPQLCHREEREEMMRTVWIASGG